MKKPDKDLLQRGYRGVDRQDAEWLKPDFDIKRQRGEAYVGGLATADNPGVVDSAALEGDDA